jgi:hypothetical protein
MKRHPHKTQNQSIFLKRKGNTTMPISDDDEYDRDHHNIAGSSAGSYQRVSFDEDAADEDAAAAAIPSANDVNGGRPDTAGADKTLRNFVVMALLFSANHGCVVSCLALASSRLGTTGAWQSGILMITYAASALLGATYAVKTLGARNAMTLGMALYCFYVGCFYAATLLGDDEQHAETTKVTIAYLGAAIGGIGAGFLWTSQGTYFGQASQDYSEKRRIPVEASNAKLAGYFAFLYLSEELLMRMLSSVLLEFGLASWGTIFGIYTLVAVGSTLAMPCVYDYQKTNNHNNSINNNNNDNNDDNGEGSTFRKATVAIKLLREDPKMKYMIGLNAVFGFTSAFLNSYVNGQVLPVALDDPDSKYVGILTSTVSVVAAVMSLLFGKIGASSGSNNGGNNSNGIILMLGALCFGGVVLPFVFQPDAAHYGWWSLLGVYALHGTGRATFEGTLRSTFADYFSYEKEGAFANIILQNGIASGIGYICTCPISVFPLESTYRFAQFRVLCIVYAPSLLFTLHL